MDPQPEDGTREIRWRAGLFAAFVAFVTFVTVARKPHA
jgi:hypothetical protein